MAIIKVGKEEINLNEDHLKFSAETMNDFLTNYAAIYRYYQNKHDDATYISQKLNDQYTKLYNAKFKQFKADNGYSDKMAEACAKSDDEVCDFLNKVRVAEYAKDELKGFLKSMDYAHNSAKEMCYNIRKELEKIYPKTVSRSDSYDSDGLKEAFGVTNGE